MREKLLLSPQLFVAEGSDLIIPFASYSPVHARKKLVGAWNWRYRQWYSEFPALLSQLKPYPTI